MRQPLTAERLRELLDYRPDEGLFYWRKRRGRVKAGTVAGTRHSQGYVQIGIDGKLYLAHRLAWLFTTGEFPAFQVDHHDLDRSNNRWENLRAATQSLNCANTRCRKDSKSGLKGVHLERRTGRWTSSIMANGNLFHLGTFSSPELAHAAYVAAAKQHFGNYARAA